MKPMGDLRQVAETIMRKLEDGSLPARSESGPTSSSYQSKSDSPARPRPSTAETLTHRQAQRREAIKNMLLRYRMERRMEAPSRDALYDEVKWHDELFTYNGIPTERLNNAGS